MKKGLYSLELIVVAVILIITSFVVIGMLKNFSLDKQRNAISQDLERVSVAVDRYFSVNPDKNEIEFSKLAEIASKDPTLDVPVMSQVKGVVYDGLIFSRNKTPIEVILPNGETLLFNPKSN